ncbi:MAG: hypothetical protein ACFE9Z_13435 [Promethearchaeota archaeon]
MDLGYIVGILLFSYGLFSVSYVVVILIINISVPFVGINLGSKDINFDLVFVFLGILLIRNKKKFNNKKRYT